MKNKINIKTQPEVETPASKEKELTQQQLEKVSGGLKMAPAAVDGGETGIKDPLKAPPL